MFKLKKMLSSQGLRQSALVAAAQLISSGLAAIALILLSRKLGPTLFGEFSVGLAIVMIVAKINDLGLNNALLKLIPTSSQKNINKYLNIIFRYKIILTLLLFLPLLSISSWLASFFNLKSQNLILIAIICGFSFVYLEQLLAQLQALHLFLKASLANILQAALKLLAVLLFLIFNLNINLAFLFYISAPWPIIFLSKLFLPKKFKFKLKITNIKLSHKILNFAKHSSLLVLSTGVSENIDLLFVQKFLSSYETGLLSAASKIAFLFVVLSASLGSVLFPRVARYKKKQDLKNYLQKILFLLVFIILLLIIILFLAKYLILYTVGSAYLPGLFILNILLISVFLGLATVPFTALFYSFDKNWYFSSVGLIQMLVIISGNLFLVPIFGLTAAASVRLITSLIIFVYTVFLSLYFFPKNKK